NFVLRFIQARIIQSPSRDPLPEIALAPKQSRTAVRTETAHIIAHHFAGCAEILRRAFGNFEGLRRDVKNRSVPSARCFLAVAAVTIERHNWFCCNFITNRAAGAAAGNRFHFATPKYSLLINNLEQLVRPRRVWLFRIASLIGLLLS